jgi:DNA-binding beta-propeller fold protein YncE
LPELFFRERIFGLDDLMQRSRNSSFVPIALLLCLGCSSYGLKETGYRASASSRPVKGLEPVAIMAQGKLGSSALNRPTGIAMDFQGNIFISDTGNDRVVKCDDQGRFLAETGGFGSGAGEFNRPAYIATDNGLNLYVVDAQNKRIQRLDRNLNFISAIDIPGDQDLPGLGLPEGIALTPSGGILVSDIEGDLLIELSGFSEYKTAYGGFGEAEGGLRDPLGVFVDRNGDIYVADSRNDRVAVFDQFGNFLRSLGEKLLKGPAGVTVSRNGSVYVANHGGNSLAVLGSEGDLIAEYGKLERGLMSLSGPTDLEFGPKGKIFLVDSGNHRVVVFEVLR